MTYHMERRSRSQSRRSLDFKAEDNINRESQEEVDENVCPEENSAAADGSCTASSDVNNALLDDRQHGHGQTAQLTPPASKPIQMWPQRLWEITNDPNNDMIKWVESGTGICVDNVKFENEVMEVYPGFVQLSSFNNLRRQLRAYSFGWHQKDRDDRTDLPLANRNLIFHHPYFIRGHPELLPYVVTRRKRGRSEFEPPDELKELSLQIQEAGASDVAEGREGDYPLLPNPYPAPKPYKRPRAGNRSGKYGTPGKLIEKAAALCEIPGLIGGQHRPLAPLSQNQNRGIGGYPDFQAHHLNASGHWSDVQKGGMSCDIPLKYWNESPDAESFPPPPVYHGQYYAPHPYDPYAYYPQYQESWGSHNHGQYYTSHPGQMQQIQGHEMQQPLENNGQYYLNQPASQYGYYEPPPTEAIPNVVVTSPAIEVPVVTATLETTAVVAKVEVPEEIEPPVPEDNNVSVSTL